MKFVSRGVAVATGRRSGRLTVRHNDASAEFFNSAERDFALFDFRLEVLEDFDAWGIDSLLSRPACLTGLLESVRCYRVLLNHP